MIRLLPHVCAKIFGPALLIETTRLDALLLGLHAAMFQRGSADLQPPIAELASPTDPNAGDEQRPRGYWIDRGVATLPIHGVLVDRAGQMTPDSTPLQSYENLSRVLAGAQRDHRVRGILLDIDSPGGEADGVFDFAAKVLSAAYVIASAACVVQIRSGDLAGVHAAIHQIGVGVPFQPYQIGRLGLFREIRLSTTTTMIEVQGERLALVPELPRGAPPTPNVEDRRSAVAFGIPHFPIRDTIYADQVQNLRAFGSTDALESVYTVVDQREAKLGRRLDLTLEFLRLGALKGIVVTATDRVSGAIDKQVNLFDRFEVPQQPILQWPIVNAGAEGQEAAAWGGGLTRLTSALGRAMAAELSGGLYTRIHGMCGSVFFDAFASHPERRAAFIALDSRPVTDPILGSTITFREVSITEYRGNINGVPLIEPDMCYFFPVGTPDLFVEIYAPADYMEAVNTLALPRYSKMEEIDFDKGVELEAQMNVLPLCTTPRALFRAQAVPWTTGSDSVAAAAPQPAAPQTNPVGGDTTAPAATTAANGRRQGGR